MTRPRPAAALLAGGLLAALPAAAQVESALLSKVSFNLSNPGGKSLAMGGAFTAIADDATAALANPAGLGLLSSIEAGLSAKRADDVTGLVTARATATGASLLGAYPAVRTINSDLGSTVSSVEFAGVVVPVSSRLVAALTFAENLRFRADPGPEGYSYIELRDNRGPAPSRRDFLYEFREYGTVSLTNRLAGLSVGYRVNERVRVGAGLTLNRASFALDGDAAGAHRIVSRYPLASGATGVSTVTTTVRDFGGTAVGAVVGFHADVLPSGALSVGGAYRQAAGTEGTFVLGGDVPPALVGARERTFTFRVPKDAALGLATQPFPGLTVAVEAQWIAYRDTIREALPVVTYAGFLEPPSGLPVENVLATLERSKNVVVPRLGVEYVATAPKALLAFRVGYHREPARGVRARVAFRDGTGRDYRIADPPLSDAVAAVYDGGRADDRFSGGLGATIARRLSLDVAFDVGRSSRRLSASVFYRF